MRVFRDRDRDTTTGTYYSVDEIPGTDWITLAMHEAARLSRAHSGIRIHTTEGTLADAVRKLHRQPSSDTRALRADLARHGKELLVSRPEREHPTWRSLMTLLQTGKMPRVSPLVTYVVHTSAFTTTEHTFTGVVMWGLGTVLVHHAVSPGDDIVTAELDMMHYVLEQGGGGGRLEVHHSADGARRIWEQASDLATREGNDSIGQNGNRLRKLLRAAVSLRTTIQPARLPDPIFDRFAKTAAADAFINQNL